MIHTFFCSREPASPAPYMVPKTVTATIEAVMMALCAFHTLGGVTTPLAGAGAGCGRRGGWVISLGGMLGGYYAYPSWSSHHRVLYQGAGGRGITLIDVIFEHGRVVLRFGRIRSSRIRRRSRRDAKTLKLKFPTSTVTVRHCACRA